MKPLLALAAAMLALAGPASADWLVLEDGQRIETRGAWEQKGSRVLYTAVSGALVSVRASEVDFEASEAATNPPPPAPAAAAGRAPAAPRAPVLVLDDSSVGRATGASSSGSPDAAEAGAAEPADSQALRIVSWEEATSSADDGLRFTGVVENTTDHFAVLVAIDVVVRGTAGSENRARASMRASSVGPHESQTFEVALSNVYAYSSVDFEISSKLLDSKPGQSPSTGGFNQPVETEPETPPSTGSPSESTPSAPEPPQG